MTIGGRRPGSGRKHRDSKKWVGCSLPREQFEALKAEASAAEVYHTRYLAAIISRHLDRLSADQDPPSRLSGYGVEPGFIGPPPPPVSPHQC